MGTVQAYSMGITLKLKNKFTRNEVNIYNIRLTKPKPQFMDEKTNSSSHFFKGQKKNTLYKNSLK